MKRNKTKEENGKSRPQIATKDMTKMALLVALICVSAYINIPLPFTDISITGQTIVVNLIGLLLTPWQALFTMVVYILLGVAGLPVFAGGVGGPGKLFGPTGGYIFGFVVAAVLIALLKGNGTNILRNCMVTILVGIPVIYLVGSVYLWVLTKMNVKAILVSAVLPFIPLDIVKCVFASFVAKPIRKAMNDNYSS